MTPLRAPIELLSPAGGPQVARAAFQYGADAVYLGLSRFSARADAENFDLDSLREVIGYAHARTPARHVYATVNTLIRPRELREAAETLFRLQECGIDAVILQDPGLLRIARKHLPRLRLHASTQMAIHNVDGALRAREDGFSRVTLARELSLAEIETIASESGLEVEIFIHGALCYGYSGLCLLSSHSTGRSGNRGRCAYCCRGLFTGDNPDGGGNRHGLPFSMKDLALADHLDAICRAGVASLKIEGRMKSALYVAAVTDYYRRRLDGSGTLRDGVSMEEDLKTIFSRPWTSLYLQKGPGEVSAVDPEQVGHRGSCIGAVQAVVRSNAGPGYWLQFTTSRALERHDGLQIDLPGIPRPFGFAVGELRVLSTQGPGRDSFVIEAPAGSRVEVYLPESFPVIPDGAPIYCASSQAVKRRYPVEMWRSGQYRSGYGMDVRISIKPDEMEIKGEVPGPGLDPIDAHIRIPGEYLPVRKAGVQDPAVQTAFRRLGDARWLPGRLEIHNPECLFVPASVLNAARRKTVTALEEGYEAVLQNVLDAAAAEALPERTPDRDIPEQWSLRIESAQALDVFTEEDLAGLDEVVWVLPISEPDGVSRSAVDLMNRMGGTHRVRVALPLIARRKDPDRLVEGIRNLAREGIENWEAAHVYGLPLLRRAGVPVVNCSADWSVYAVNGAAARQAFAAGFSRITLSPEAGSEDLESMLRDFGDRANTIVFQDTPLMISDTPPWGKRGLEEMSMHSAGRRYHARAHEGRYWILDETPFCLASQLEPLRRAGARLFRVDFGWRRRSASEQVALWRTVRAGRSPAQSHSARFPEGLR